MKMKQEMEDFFCQIDKDHKFNENLFITIKNRRKLI